MANHSILLVSMAILFFSAGPKDLHIFLALQRALPDGCCTPTGCRWHRPMSKTPRGLYTDWATPTLLGHIAAQAVFFLDYIGFDNACMDKIRDVLFSLFLQQYFAHQLLFAGAKEFGLDKGVFFVESGEIHLQLLSRCRRIYHERAFLFGARDKPLLSLSKRSGAKTKNEDNAMDNALHRGFPPGGK
jgi:hypothetical protein